MKRKRRGKKKKGKIWAILSGIILIVLLMDYFHLIPHKKYTNADFGIETLISSVDKDGDGVDDQTDILQNTRAYIATKPKYKSQYYGTGYPDDEYGVCTDVVAFALLDAGYDLQKLVDEDIRNNMDEYDIEDPDEKIDFRRVKNLIVYFRRNAVSLTTDPTQIEEWQGGDIVIFPKHIAIVSDKRNKDGVPYIIHNGSTNQVSYEQDRLSNYDDIVGHYRISE